MTLMTSRRSFAGLLAAAALAGRAVAQPQTARQAGTKLEQVAEFADQVTGVAVARGGRIFVNFPRWEKDVAISVAEVMQDGALRPYPDAAWNRWRNADPAANNPANNAARFVCVQSVTVDPQGFLWIVDAAAPGNEFNLGGGPKLLKVDLGSDRVTRVYPVDRTACPQGSYLNDVRISPDGRTAYVTDSGVRGALLVLDTATGKVRRLLDGHPSTQIEKTVTVMADGAPLKRPDGRGPMFAADGIALSRDGKTLFWQALTGRTIYRASAEALRKATPSQAGALVERVGTGVVADGYLIDRMDRHWVTSPEDNSVKRHMPDGSLQTVVTDARLRWPDSMAEGGDGALYVTASHIQDMAMYTGTARKGTTQLFRFMPPA